MIIETTVLRPAGGGEFIALHEGRIVFVSGAISGERVRVDVTNPDAKLWRGSAIEILEPSPLRVDAMCDAAQHGAGCCDWDFIDRDGAASLKREVLVDCLTRLGGFDREALPEIQVATLTPTTQWRNRVRLGVDKRGRAGLRANQSNNLVLGASCCQNVDGLTEGLDKEGFVPIPQPKAHARRRVRGANPGELHVVMDTSGTRNVVHVQGRGRNHREQVLEGSGTYQERVGGITFEVPVTGFWQAHIAAVPHYVKRIKELLPEAPGATAWDLYGGVGVFALALAEKVGSAGRVLSVEAFPDAAAAGRKALSNLPVEFVTGDVEKVVRELVRTGSGLERPELVVLDPPRAGAGTNAIQAIASASPRHVVHIGCDPATFARDAKAWAGLGYETLALDVIDAFPGTHHFETIALLGKGD